MGNNCSVLHGQPKHLSIKLKSYLQTKFGTHIFNHRTHEGEYLNTDCEIFGNCILVRTTEGLEVVSSYSEYHILNKNTIAYMVDIRFGPHGIIVGEQAFQYPEDPLTCPIWQVVSQKETPVQVGDIFKLSSHVIKVVDIKFAEGQQIVRPALQQGTLRTSALSSRCGSRTEERICKVCYQPQTSPNDPIIVPCKCQGTIKYIHVQCLRGWITNSRSYSASQTGMRIRKDAFMCNVCKTNYESSLFQKNRQLGAIMLEDKVQPPYIKFQVLSQNPNDDHFIIVESFAAQDKIAIGRKSSCQIKMGLVHLSRFHSELSIDRENRQIYIEDMRSAFGTLRYIHGPNIMNIKDQMLKLQVGNMVIDVVVNAKSIPKSQRPVLNPFLESPAIIAEGQKLKHASNSLKLVPSVQEFAQLSHTENQLVH